MMDTTGKLPRIREIRRYENAKTCFETSFSETRSRCDVTYERLSSDGPADYRHSHP
jgi:hypothetical protein